MAIIAVGFVLIACHNHIFVFSAYGNLLAIATTNQKRLIAAVAAVGFEVSVARVGKRCFGIVENFALVRRYFKLPHLQVSVFAISTAIIHRVASHKIRTSNAVKRLLQLLLGGAHRCGNQCKRYK